MSGRDDLIRSLGTITLEAGWIDVCGDLGDLLDGLLVAGWRAPEPTVCGSHIIYRGVRLACDLVPDGIPHEHHGKPRTPGPHVYWGDVDDGLEVD